MVSNDEQTLVIVVFCHETKELTYATAVECFKSLENIPPELKLGFIFVDDGSQENYTSKMIDKSLNLLLQSCHVAFSEKIRHDVRLGLAASLHSSVRFLLETNRSRNVWITQIPGNDQLSSKSLARFLEFPMLENLTILWRSNTRSRPALKRFASYVLQGVVRRFLFPEVQQVTGNFIAPIALYNNWLLPSSGHAYGLWLIAGAKNDGIPIVQRDFELKQRAFARHTAVRKLPKVQNVILMLVEIIRVKKFIQKNS
jgi:hypothetical protein